MKSIDKMTSEKNKLRLSWWSVTAFGEDAERIVKMQDEGKFDHKIKKIYGGLEVCPSTQKEHFQGAVHTTQIYFTTMKQLFPRCHIESARKKEALVKYAMKEETSLGDKRDVSNGQFYTSAMFLYKLAEYAIDSGQNNYEVLCSRFLEYVGIDMISMVTNPRNKQAWMSYKRVYINKVKFDQGDARQFGDEINEEYV